MNFIFMFEEIIELALNLVLNQSHFTRGWMHEFCVMFNEVFVLDLTNYTSFTVNEFINITQNLLN